MYRKKVLKGLKGVNVPVTVVDISPNILASSHQLGRGVSFLDVTMCGAPALDDSLLIWPAETETPHCREPSAGGTGSPKSPLGAHYRYNILTARRQKLPPPPHPRPKIKVTTGCGQEERNGYSSSRESILTFKTTPKTQTPIVTRKPC